MPEANGGCGGNGMTRSNGETAERARTSHAGEAGRSAGRWIERHRNSQAFRDRLWLVIAGALYPIRAKRITGMDSVRAPCLRCSVSCRFLRNLRSPPAFRRVSHEMERRSRGH